MVAVGESCLLAVALSVSCLGDGATEAGEVSEAFVLLSIYILRGFFASHVKFLRQLDEEEGLMVD
jgi:TPP-dependent pyruvate/acetoin dehydrogenase alpha subunit